MKKGRNNELGREGKRGMTEYIRAIESGMKDGMMGIINKVMALPTQLRGHVNLRRIGEDVGKSTATVYREIFQSKC